MARASVIDPKSAIDAEIVTHGAMDSCTYLLGKATQVEIDLPRVELHRAA